ncbi:hypothetical protein K457DRAFT_18220 [Linnemannia elongata AG-77]|uniref:BZIP domain-containing protein n=1 Tax=Linnemannia elongata AG-77 TaxID=1314771 RepID=A0A197K1M7_9FUNG|nr:hypothetical protein K457DRAFT_18220 [Linnemannia elongata AG-77]
MNNHQFSASPMGAMVNSTTGSLNFAPSYQDKKSAGLRSRQSLLDFGSNINTNSSNSNSNNVDVTFGPTPEIASSLFDDWLSSDLQQAGFVVPTEYDDSSSSDSEYSSASPASSHQHSHSPILLPTKKEEESPVVGFASLDRDLLIQSPRQGIDSTMSFFPDLTQTAYGRALAASANLTALAQQHQQQQQQQQQQHHHQQQQQPQSMNPLGMASLAGLTPEAVQQAAAALNIPWSKSLEQAVLAQSLLASFAAAASSSSSPSSPNSITAPLLRQQQQPLAPLMPKQGASMTVAHDLAMDISPPGTPLMPTMSMTMSSPSPKTPTMSSFSSERASSVIGSPPPSHHHPTLAPATTTTPRLSILSSSQSSLSLPGASSPAIKATTYKSTYRSASLSYSKRDRPEFEEPPSVLEGKDLSEMDEVSLKRAKNTDAARRSRHKKLIKMESLEQRVAELEVENSMFESKLNEVELERSLLADKDCMQQARIQELEQQLLLAAAAAGQQQHQQHHY